MWVCAYIYIPGGDLTKIYHEAQPPHEVITPFHIPYSTTDFAIPFHLQRSPKITTKGVKLPIIINDHFSVVDLWKDPFFRFHNAGTAGQKHPKTWKMAIGSVWSSPPWDKNLYIMNSISSLYFILFQAANHWNGIKYFVRNGFAPSGFVCETEVGVLWWGFGNSG